MGKGNKPFDKESDKRIPFEELVRLIGQNCDYKFAIIDYEVDEELQHIAKQKVFIYEKRIGDQYIYVEEIRQGRNKSLAFQSFRRRKASK